MECTPWARDEWPKTRLGHEVGSSGSCRRAGTEGWGGSVAAGWQEGAKSQSRLRVCSWLMQYTLCTNWLISPLSWQRPHQVHAPRGKRAPWGRAGSSNTFLALKGKRGGSADGASPYKKRGENSLNNGTKLRLSPEASRPQAGRDAVQSLLGLGH